MSIYPKPDKLDAMESKYALVILAAKRARQLKEGGRPLIESAAPNSLTAALEEIADGAVIARTVEDASVAAHQAALKPNTPSLEDIIGAGPVLAIEADVDTTSADIAAFRIAEPDTEAEETAEEEGGEGLHAADTFDLEGGELLSSTDEEDEEDELITDVEEE